MDSSPQTRGPKRKAEHKLSTNPHTKKVRAYIKKMTDDKKEIEKLKRSDQAAFTYIRSKVRKTAEFISADAKT